MNHISLVRTLYKRILKLHRGLPMEARELGDRYVHDEFRRHKSVNNVEADVFMKEWTMYYLELSKQLSSKAIVQGKKLGRNLEGGDLEKMTDQQIAQLYDLKVETDKPRNNKDSADK